MLTFRDRIREYRDRGVTPVESLFALGFMGLVGLMMIQLARSGRFYADTSARAANSQEARQVMNRAVRALQNARPLGICGDNPQIDIRIESCRRVDELPFQVHSASTDGGSFGGSEICFWAQLEATADPFAPPGLVCVTEDSSDGKVFVRFWEPDADATYTSPVALAARTTGDPNGGAAPESNQLVGEVDAARTEFRFFDASGTELSDSVLATDEGRQAVAYVEFQVVVLGGGDRRVGDSEIELNFNVGLRGSRIDRDQSSEVG